MSLQELTLKKVKAAAKKAFLEGKLTAQAKRKKDRECIYQKGEYRCVIGWALTDKTLAKVMKINPELEECLNCGYNVGDLEHYSCIALPSEGEERNDIIEIQIAHDEWCDAGRTKGMKDALTLEAKEEFRKLIGA